MNPMRILAILLIVGGVAGFAYGQFSYTKETHDAKIGPIELSMKEKETVHVPEWMAAAALASGVLMLVFDRKQA